jgi:hypothetical protein
MKDLVLLARSCHDRSFAEATLILADCPTAIIASVERCTSWDLSLVHSSHFVRSLGNEFLRSTPRMAARTAALSCTFVAQHAQRPRGFPKPFNGSYSMRLDVMSR